jgi:hypothetical protein
MRDILIFFLLTFSLISCKKNPDPAPIEPPASFSFNSLLVDGKFNGYDYLDVDINPVIKISFTAALDTSTVAAAVTFVNNTSSATAVHLTFENNDSTIVIQPVTALNFSTKYTLNVSNALKSAKGGSLLATVTVTLTTSIDSTNKFPPISDDSLLTLIQKQTFRFFWEFGHPVSGMARDRNTSGDLVTSGGTGFGVMAIVVAIERNFITRAQGLDRLTTIVNFLQTKAQRYHGVFPHWLNGATGATIPFSPNDNGADLVETSYLMQGLITARQYFNDPANTQETELRTNINTLLNEVEWDWFRKNNQNVLYWHWSPTLGWIINMKVQGWNEALIVYVLAASSPTHTIDKIVYDNGWAKNGAIANKNIYYGVKLPLGEPYGGPLFFAHYSFLGINPNNLTDQYADYWQQNVNHSLINFKYCVANPKSFKGYSKNCWGLTASDIPDGYTASSPTNDVSVIAPTAAISSLPYTPVESMQAIRYFYFKLGDKLWKSYGFIDAFSMEQSWFASSFLAIDQGPQIIMIENYRTALLWNLFMSAPEVQTGLTKLGFSYK